MTWERRQGVLGLCVRTPIRPTGVLERCDTASQWGKRRGQVLRWRVAFVISVPQSPAVVELFVLLVWIRNRGYAGLDPGGKSFRFHF